MEVQVHSPVDGAGDCDGGGVDDFSVILTLQVPEAEMFTLSEHFAVTFIDC